jgi:hypothetical protein
MKKQIFALTMAMAVTLASSTASAETFGYTYTGNGDGVVATGMLTGDLSAPGAYLITSGTIDLTGAGSLDGTGLFVPNPGTGVFQTGGGTQLILAGTDSLLYPFASQLIGNNGLFLFQMGAGQGVGLFSNEPDSPGYGMFGGNWTLNDKGAIDVTPEPSSLLLVGSGMMVLASAARTRFARV